MNDITTMPTRREQTLIGTVFGLLMLGQYGPAAAAAVGLLAAADCPQRDLVTAYLATARRKAGIAIDPIQLDDAAHIAGRNRDFVAQFMLSVESDMANIGVTLEEKMDNLNLRWQAMSLHPAAVFHDVSAFAEGIRVELRHALANQS